MSKYMDTQLKRTLALMLPNDLVSHEYMPHCASDRKDAVYEHDAWRYHSGQFALVWKDCSSEDDYIRDTELLHLCQMVELTLDSEQSADYAQMLPHSCATWQERVITLASVKGVTIPV